MESDIASANPTRITHFIIVPISISASVCKVSVVTPLLRRRRVLQGSQVTTQTLQTV
jgi:hypothetical protein